MDLPTFDGKLLVSFKGLTCSGLFHTLFIEVTYNLPIATRISRVNHQLPNHQNALIDETSPYLLQHAHNPVNWFPWNEKALEHARHEDKPILLSIGYSACHWCHVMAHESFEDENTAALMNTHFVNIKVDREERPDLDRIYQTAHQALNRRGGGWPLTVFLAPDTHTPFFAGTYFPKVPRYGMISFRELLLKVRDYYQENRADIHADVARWDDFFARISIHPPASSADLNLRPLDSARHELASHFDAQLGGFSEAPKFPHPSYLERLLRHWALTRDHGTPDQTALDMAITTLTRMAEGGIHDQLGGGFCRYSVDERWLIPHFEKMLYDNGPLLTLYADAWQITRNPLFRDTACDTATWLMSTMQSPEGGYYSSLDADSEGVEGRYYVWDPQSVQDLLTVEEAAITLPFFGLENPANFEGHHWHLYVAHELSAIAVKAGIEPSAAQILLASAREKLFAAQQKRIAPGRDEKILTAWNALTIIGMARAGRLLSQPDYIDSARRAFDFLRRTMWINGRLTATYKDGRARLNAYLDDYAFLLAATLEMLQTHYRDDDLQFARDLADALLDHFTDLPQGGFFFTSHDHERLLQRPKVWADEATPSGNGVTAWALSRLGHILAEPRYLDAAQQTLRAAWRDIVGLPSAHCTLLHALEELHHPPQLIFLRGDLTEVNAWHATLNGEFAPRRLIFPLGTAGHTLPGGQDTIAPKSVRAYRCDHFACSAPIHDLPTLIQELKTKST